MNSLNNRTECIITILIDIPLEIYEITVSREILLDPPACINFDAISRIILDVDGAVPFK